ncbi:hypothetical protein ACOME3_008959 [Neoechinorhynchus agilis]
MLVDPVKQPFRIKIIDFGWAITPDPTANYTCIQNRIYRAPEIIIGYQFIESIDMWSLAVTLVTLYLGCYMYPGYFEFEQLKYITDTQGPLPMDMLIRGTKTAQFFDVYRQNSGDLVFELKNVNSYNAETGLLFRERRRYQLHSLDDLAILVLRGENIGPNAAAQELDRLCFTDLMKKMLTLDPHVRMSAILGLEHPFLTLDHLFAEPEYLQGSRNDMKRPLLNTSWLIEDYRGTQRNI